MKVPLNGISDQIIFLKNSAVSISKCSCRYTIPILQVSGFMLYDNFFWRHLKSCLFVSFPQEHNHSSINSLLLLLIVELAESASFFFTCYKKYSADNKCYLTVNCTYLSLNKNLWLLVTWPFQFERKAFFLTYGSC